MSRLDHHIARVRTKLTADLFLQAWGRALLVGAGVALAYALARTFVAWRLPKETYFGLGLLAATAVVALIVAMKRRPGAMVTATAIDDRLRLNEKFSTALHARQSNDAFAQAAVLDAEQAAAAADVRGQFKLHWPKPAGFALAVLAVAGLLLGLVTPRNLFASNNPKKPTTLPATEIEREKAKKIVQNALTAINNSPKAANEQAAVQLAKAELQDLLKKPDLTPDAGQRKALSALQDLNKAIDQAEKTQKFADAKNAAKLLEKMKPEESESGAVADAQRDLSKGDLDAAMKKLEQTVDKFDQMTDQQKADAARQMQKMAQQLQQMANASPQQQQKQQQQLQQMGLSQQQAQQAQKLMQQAAQGNQQAAQQLQQMAQQAMKQMNNGQGPTQQQMQQAQQMMQQMQAGANNQQQAQQLQQAAAQMAQAMQQAAGQNPQTAAGAKQGQSQQGQQAQPGQQANAQQQMQQAQQQMQQAMQQMQAAQQDANQVAAGQQQAQQALADAQGAMNSPGNEDGQGTGQGQKAGGQKGGNQNVPGQGSRAGKGHTASTPTGGPDSPFTIDKKTATGQVDDKGRLLAGSLVKADAPKGESKAALQTAVKNAQQDAADEVDSDRIGKQSQKVVRDYFGSMTE